MKVKCISAIRSAVVISVFAPRLGYMLQALTQRVGVLTAPEHTDKHPGSVKLPAQLSVGHWQLL